MIPLTTRAILFLACSFALIFFSCNRDIEKINPIAFDYYPLIKGKYKIYQIDSTVYDEYNCSKIYNSYQIKEVTTQTSFDGENAPIYILERYHRENDSKPWVLLNIWSEKIEENQLQRVEENQRFIKMVFPIKENRKWDGITYIRKDTTISIRGGSISVFKDWDNFSYKNTESIFVDTSQNIPQVYQNTVEVLQADKENKIEKRFSKEVYAKNIGLIYKEMWILNTQCSCPSNAGSLANCYSKTWQEKAEKGYILVQSLLEHNY